MFDIYIQDVEDLEEMLLSGKTLKEYLNCFHCKTNSNDEFAEYLAKPDTELYQNDEESEIERIKQEKTLQEEEEKLRQIEEENMRRMEEENMKRMEDLMKLEEEALQKNCEEEKAHHMKHEDEEEQTISIVKALLNYSDVNYHMILSMMMKANYDLTLFMNYPTVQDLINYIVH